jgi:hypothetical protein
MGPRRFVVASHQETPMPDRYTLELETAVASNTGGPYTYTWDRVIVPATGVVRGVSAVAVAIQSNARLSTVDIYRQPDAPAAGSNTATSILQSPLQLINDRDVVFGTPTQPGSLLTAGDVLELRTDGGPAATNPHFTTLNATVEIERT